MAQHQSDRQPFRLAVTLLGVTVVAAASALLVLGWVLDVSAVRAVIPGSLGMKTQTALGLGVGAGALLLLDDRSRNRGRTLGFLFASIPGLLGVGVLSEYALHRAGIAYPGGFSPTTGVCFLLLTGALLTLDRGAGRLWRPSELLAIPLAIVAFMSLIGYAYSIPALYGPGSTAKIAVNTSLCFLALAIAILLARPRARVVELSITTDPGGVMVRRMVPLCAITPLVLGWLHLRTVSWGVFNDQVGTWWMAAATSAGLVGLICWCAGSLSRADRQRRVLEGRLFELANRDSLTGLFNRHRFEEELEQLLARARRYGDTGSLLMFDLDRMKSINDTLGHGAGDALLCAVARVVSERLRESDSAGRLGGDEFAVLLLEATPSAAADVADELRQAIAEIQIETGEGKGRSTASIGVAPVDKSPGLTSAELLRRVDAAMYRAKRAGGNRVALTEYVSAFAETPSAVLGVSSSA
jgi:diguanylate cyclase (GGDEF)-like protein